MRLTASQCSLPENSFFFAVETLRHSPTVVFTSQKEFLGTYAQFPLLRSELRFATVWTYVGSRGKPWPKP